MVMKQVVERFSSSLSRVTMVDNDINMVAYIMTTILILVPLGFLLHWLRQRPHVTALRSMQSDRLRNPKYGNWVKTSLSLLYLKEGITKFSDEKAGEFHKDVKDSVRLKSVKAVTSNCTKCTQKSAIKTKTQNKKASTWRMNCSSNVCSVWLEQILPYHIHLPLPKIAWANSNPQMWPSDVWELAKLFQPYGCENHSKAEESDCAALLTMMLDCTFFHKFLTNTACLREIKEVRNACMHSRDQEIDDQDMTKALDLMVALLEEPFLKNRQECITAKAKIIQLRDNALELSLNKDLENRANNNKFAEFRTDIKRLAAEHQQMKADLNTMANRQDSTVEECNELRDRMSKVNQEIAEMTKNWQSIQQTHDPSLGGKVDDLTSKLQDLQTKIQADDENVQATMAIYEARLLYIETKKLRDNALELSLNKDLEIRALNNKLAEVRMDIERLAAEHQQTKADLNTITDRQDSTVEECNELRDRVSKVKQEIAEMTKNWQSIQQTHDPSLGGKVDDLTSKLQDLQTKIQADDENVQAAMAIYEARLLYIETKKEEGKQNRQTPEPAITQLDDICVKTEGDTDKCWITGSSLLPRNRLILADCKNEKVKLVNLQTSVVTAELKTSSYPWYITSISGDTVAVTVPNSRKIMIVKVTVQLRLDRELPVDGECRAVLHSNGNLLVSYISPCKIEIMSLDGKATRKIAHSESFQRPLYMALSENNKALYVSDYYGCCVTRLSLDGAVEATYKDMKLDGPAGVVGVGQQGRLLVCGDGSGNIHLLEPSLTQGKVLLQEIGRSQSLSYCHSTGRLYVGMMSDNIKVYQLS